MSKFEVAHEAESLAHGDIPKCLEDHQSKRAAGLDVAEYEFGQDVETDLVVGDGLNNSNRQREAEGDCYGQQERPPRQVGGECEHGDEANGKHLRQNILECDMIPASY